MPQISLQAEKIGHIFGMPITNSMLTSWVVMLILIVGGFLLTRKLEEIPGNSQSFIEIIIENLYDLFQGITGKLINKFFPLLATFFIFIITANWIGLLPGVGSIGIKEKEETVHIQEINGSENNTAVKTESKEKIVPLFRAATADLNTTIALAIIAIVSIQYYGFKELGAKTQISKYFNFTNPINFYVGILELISEFSRLISFAFRLFGNIFAGEVLLTIIAFLVPVIAPLPFLALELFVGFIQALVFSMLTAVLLNVATQHESH